MDGIDLHTEEQIQLMMELSQHWDGIPDNAVPNWRYRPSWFFPRSDATVYHGMLRHFAPKRLVEVGSGFTSALALDTRERCLPHLNLTFIDPFTQRLQGLLREGDRLNCRIITRPVQEVPLHVFDELQSGDFLFLDTGHIAKTGSEVNWLVFNVLPRLSRGVLVHVHDMFWPFEYMQKWLDDGRSYSELYLVRAFLMFNDTFDILLFCNWIWQHHRELFRAIPDDHSGIGPTSLWLQKRG